jgi:phospholipase C
MASPQANRFQWCVRGPASCFEKPLSAGTAHYVHCLLTTISDCLSRRRTRLSWVNSQLFDHTSLIRFLEARFAAHRPGLIETNITPWRRAVVGDLTSAFDFKTPNGPRRALLPGTDAFKPDDLVRHPDEVLVLPTNQDLPQQESGVRPARALPYTLEALGALQLTDGSFWIQFRNTGRAAAVFHVRSGNSTDLPRSYTVEPHKHVNDVWEIAAVGATDYDISVYGPNGFYRSFKGRIADARQTNIAVVASYNERDNEIALTIANRASHNARLVIFSRYTSRATHLLLGPGETDSKTWSLQRFQGWYDLAISVESDPRFQYHLAGHLEDGEDSISDPMMGGLV